MPTHALSYVGVSKRFRAHVALDDVSFEVQRGEVFGLLGPNGAGKTTLIRLALDILRPDEGEVRLLGDSVRTADHDRVAYLPEERGLYRQQRVIDVLRYLARLKGIPKADARARSMHWLDKVGLAHVASMRVEQLSKGMSQKVQIAATLVADPVVAILDEPFSGLDPLHVEHVLELIRERRAAGQTTILSTHLMDRVEAVCDRMVLMSRGQRVLYGTLDEIRGAHVRAEVRVEISGFDPATLDAVEQCVSDADGTARLVLRVGTDPAALLAELVTNGARVSRFEPARVSLEHIFVSTVRGREPRRDAEGEPARDPEPVREAS